MKLQPEYSSVVFFPVISTYLFRKLSLSKRSSQVGIVESFNQAFYLNSKVKLREHSAHALLSKRAHKMKACKRMGKHGESRHMASCLRVQFDFI